MTGESQRNRIMHAHAIRALLLAAEDGMTAGQLAKPLGISPSRVNAILKDEYGFYVDRWETNKSGSFTAVWFCVEVPANCPPPTPGAP